MAPGEHGSCKEAGLIPCIRVSDYININEINGKAYLNCCVIKEKIRSCALESTKTTSSLPHTEDSCKMETSAWLYHGARLTALP